MDEKNDIRQRKEDQRRYLPKSQKNYAIKLTDGTWDDLEKKLIDACTLGIEDSGIKSSAKHAVDIAISKKDYHDNTLHTDAGHLYKKYGVIVLRGCYGTSFDNSYWLAKCAKKCAQETNLAKYANEPESRRNKDIGFAVVEWVHNNSTRERGRVLYTSIKDLYEGHGVGDNIILSNYASDIAKIFGVPMTTFRENSEFLCSDGINALKADGKYYYMDISCSNAAVTSLDDEYCAFYTAIIRDENGNRPAYFFEYPDDYSIAKFYSTPEYTALLDQLLQLDLSKGTWNILKQASQTTYYLAQTVVNQMIAADPEFKYATYSDYEYNPDYGDLRYAYHQGEYQTCCSSALDYLLSNYLWNKEIIIRHRYYDDIYNGIVSPGEAYWLTFDELAGKGGTDSNFIYKNTPYGKIYSSTSITGEHPYGNIFGYRTEKKLIAVNKVRKGFMSWGNKPNLIKINLNKKFKPTGSVQNVYI